MLRLQANRFSDSQARTIHCLDQNPMFQVLDAGKKTRNLLHAEHNREFTASRSGWQSKTIINFSITDMPVEVSDAAEIILA